MIEKTDKLLARRSFSATIDVMESQQLNGVVESILQRAGFELTAVADAHLCCGSAGTYSILQRSLSQRLLERKLSALGSGAPDVIATANIGCYTHLMSRSTVPVRHWIELLDD